MPHVWCSKTCVSLWLWLGIGLLPCAARMPVPCAASLSHVALLGEHPVANSSQGPFFKVPQQLLRRRPHFPRSGPLSEQYARLPFAQEHLQVAPRIFRFVIIPVAGCALLLTSIIIGKHAWEHLSEGERRRATERKIFRPLATTCIFYVVMLFPLISLTSFLTLLAPRNTVLLLVVARTYEAFALFAFFELLLCLMGDPEEAIAEMEQQEPFRIYGVPPLCCCVCVAPAMTMNRDRFIFARNLVLQYCVVGPLSYLISAWNSGYVPWTGMHEPRQWLARHLVSHGLKILSTLLCFWGLFQLYRATQFRLHNLETTRKFALIKVMLILVEVVHLAVSMANKYVDFSDDPVYDDEIMANAWIHMTTCVVVAPLACLVPASFPVKDLEYLDSRSRLWRTKSSHL